MEIFFHFDHLCGRGLTFLWIPQERHIKGSLTLFDGAGMRISSACDEESPAPVTCEFWLPVQERNTYLPVAARCQEWAEYAQT